MVCARSCVFLFLFLFFTVAKTHPVKTQESLQNFFKSLYFGN